MAPWSPSPTLGLLRRRANAAVRVSAVRRFISVNPFDVRCAHPTSPGFASGRNNLCRPMSPRTRVCHCKPLIRLNRRGPFYRAASRPVHAFHSRRPWRTPPSRPRASPRSQCVGVRSSGCPKARVHAMHSRLARRRSFMMRGRPQRSVHRIQGLIDLVLANSTRRSRRRMQARSPL